MLTVGSAWAASVQDLGAALRWTQPDQTDPLWDTAESLSQTGGVFGKMYLRKGKTVRNAEKEAQETTP